MKLKALFVALAAAALCASVAYASPPPGKGHHNGRGGDTTEQTQGPGRHGHAPAAACKGRRLLLLAGTYVSGSADSTGAGTFAMLVKRAAGHGKGLDLRGKQATLTVDAQTKVRRHGPATLADLVAGDRLVVLVRVCRASGDAGADPAAPTLLARGIVARPATGDGDGTGTTTSGTTTDDTTTTDTTPKTGTGPSLS